MFLRPMSPDALKVLRSAYFPAGFTILLWIIWLFCWYFQINVGFLGIIPLRVEGLPGIITSPLLHGDIGHITANSLPVFILSFGLFYYYREIAWQIIILSWVVTGIWVWTFARESSHIGASGLIYAWASFHFFSSLFRRNPRIMAFTLFIIFLYGGMVWGMFPDFVPRENISWESHLMGGIAGLVLAIYFRKSCPQPEKYHWDEDDEEDDENAYWKASDHTGNFTSND